MKAILSISISLLILTGCHTFGIHKLGERVGENQTALIDLQITNVVRQI